MSRGQLVLVGGICFLSGGAVLALVAGRAGTALGTTLGLVGLGLMILGVARRSAADE